MMRLALILMGGVAAASVLALIVWIYVVQNVEQPRYDLVTSVGAIEVRQYPALVVAEVTRTGDRQSAVRAGFGPLARYIFARDRDGASISMTAPVTQQKIAMTAPVTQTRTDGEAWTVRFIMPSAWSLETLPKPGSGDVRLLSVPPARKAAIRFSGVATDALIAEKERELRAWLAAQGLSAAGAATYAYYNDPWTPGPLRRNEVLITLQAG
jgi:hypothetical protein